MTTTNHFVLSATINGEWHEFLADERDSLLEALRERAGQAVLQGRRYPPHSSGRD